MASKEIIKENQVPATLFVGLGGVGWLIGWLLHYAKESTHENKG